MGDLTDYMPDGPWPVVAHKSGNVSDKEGCASEVSSKPVQMLEALRAGLRQQGPDTVRDLPTVQRVLCHHIDAILDAMPEGPGLPWVNVWDREPTEEDGDRQGNVLWASYKSVIVSPWNLEMSAYDKWLPLSDIPLPTDSGWIDVGVETVSDTCGAPGPDAEIQLRFDSQDVGRRFHVMIKPVEDTE